MNFDLKTVF